MRRFFTAIICSICLGLIHAPVQGQVNDSNKMNASVFFRIGKSTVDPNFMNNRIALHTLIDSLSKMLADTNYVVKKITVVGRASLDGKEQVNIALAGRRAKSVSDYICAYANIPRELIETVNRGEDWAGLRAIVAASTIVRKQEVLSIFDTIEDRDTRKYKLMFYADGVPWKYMQEKIFPIMRAGAGITIERIERKSLRQTLPLVTPIPSDTTQNDTVARPPTAPEIQATNELPSAVTVAKTVAKTEVLNPINTPEKRTSSFTPLLSIKTNLVLWAGLMPDFETKMVTPNIAAEISFAGRWSVEVSGAYADFNYKDNKHWGVSSAFVEPRFWIRNNSRFRGLYVGAYGQYGDFDDCQGLLNSDNATGNFMGAGLSVGYLWAITNRFGLELNFKGGFRKAKYDTYTIEDANLYHNESFTKNTVELTGLRLNLVFRMGCTN